MLAQVLLLTAAAGLLRAQPMRCGTATPQAHTKHDRTTPHPAGAPAATGDAVLNDQVRVIPVVFHVIHAGGEENISYAQIEDGLRALNEDYRRLNADQSETRAVFRPVASDTHVEFRPARIDPDGNCTDGVVRVFSPLTDEANIDTDNVKELSRWPTDRYLNVWVVKRLFDPDLPNAEYLGYAEFPGVGPPDLFGLVVRHDQVGTIGTGATNPYRTLTHEVGHCLNLKHTFEGGCNLGDGVDDTPPSRLPTYGCDASQNTCADDTPDRPDQIENYMSYDLCQNMFTEGQRLRIQEALNNPAFRLNNLWQAGNRAATGTDDGHTAQTCQVKIDFAAPTLMRPTVCVGTAVQYAEYVYNADPDRVQSWRWSFPGGTPGTATTRVPPPVVYTAPGRWATTLTVTTPEGEVSLTRSDLIDVQPARAALAAFYTESFERSDFPDNSSQPEATWAVESPAFFSWRRTEAAARSGGASVSLRNQFMLDGTVSDLFMPSVDLTPLGSTPHLVFSWAYARRILNNNDRLAVELSLDCGQTWQPLWSAVGRDLSTVGERTFGGLFVPTAAEWRSDTLPLPAAVVGDGRNVRFRFRATSRGGNALYLDDVSVGDLITSSPEAYGFSTRLLGNPTPRGQNAALELTTDRTTRSEITVFDALGRMRLQPAERPHAPGTHRILLTTGELPSGLYLIRVRAAGRLQTHRLIVR
ncbi:MAG: M43 family zinc metalloprotease [Catalinimonas sp.]